MPNQSEPFLVMKSVLRYTAAQVYIVSPDLWPMAAWSCDTRDQSCAIGCSRSAVQIHNTLTTATSTTYEPPIYMQRVLHTDTSKTKVCVKQFHSFALVPLIPVHPSILPCFFFSDCPTPEARAGICLCWRSSEHTESIRPSWSLSCTGCSH